MPTDSTTIYDYPKWYDLVYGSDWRAEFSFLQRCFRDLCDIPVRSLLEPACGTGRLLFRFAKAGYQVVGLDLNHSAVDFCNRRLVKHGFEPTAFIANMCGFQLPHSVQGAFNTVSSFRHVIGWQQAIGHLQAMAEVLDPGGFYILGLHLTPTRGHPSDDEQWSSSQGLLTINTDMWLIDRDWNRRLETYRLTFHVYTPTRTELLDTTVQFQMYTRRDFIDLLKEVPQFRLHSVFDFRYDVDQPIPLTDSTEDAVFLLQRVEGTGRV